MRRKVVAPLFCVFVSLQFGQAIPAPTGLISIAGDKSVVLHWDRVSDPTLSGYHVYRSTSGAIGPFSLAGAGVLTGPGFCDISGSVLNGRTNFYFVRTVATNSVESAPSQTNAALPHVFVNDDECLDYVQQTCFFYFWYAANPKIEKTGLLHVIEKLIVIHKNVRERRVGLRGRALHGIGRHRSDKEEIGST